MQVTITGRVGDSAAAYASGRIEFAQAQRMDNGELIVTSRVATAQLVNGELRNLSGMPFALPSNPEGTAVRVRELLGGASFEWWTAVPDQASIEYRLLEPVESSSVPESVWGIPPWLQQALDASAQTVQAIEDATELVETLGGLSGLQDLSDQSAASAAAASASATAASGQADRAEAAAASIDMEAINERLDDVDAGLSQRPTESEVLAMFSERRFTANVREYGAVANGTTDDTAAVRAAADAVRAAGGGTILFPAGVYRVDGFTRLPANTSVFGYGATILKTFSSASGFSSIAFGALGGAGWIRNIGLYGLTFRGNLPTNGVMALWGHRVSSLTVRDVTAFDAVAGGHVFDLMGCEDWLIENCTFSGAQAPSGREYAEAIQLDASNYTGSPFIAENSTETFDGTATKRGVVRRCRFLKQGSLLAPRAIGCHSAVQDRPYRDITFEDNYIETPQTSAGWTSVINFLNTRNVTVRDNTFNIDSGTAFPFLVNFSLSDNWTPLAQVNSPTATTVPSSGGTVSKLKSVYGNRSSSSHAMVSNLYDDVASFATGFKAYGSTAVPQTEIAGGMVDFAGAFGLVNATQTATQAGIAADAGVVVATLPPEVAPKRLVTRLCQGSGRETWQMEIRPDGTVRVTRYSDGTRVNPWLVFSTSWARP